MSVLYIYGYTDRKSEVVETVDDVEHGRLAALDQVDGLEEGGGRHAVLLGAVVEVLQVVHGLEGDLGVGLELNGGQVDGGPQLVEQSEEHKAR